MSLETPEQLLTPEQQEIATLRARVAELEEENIKLDRLAFLDTDLEVYNKKGMMRMAEVLLPRDEREGETHEADASKAERPPIAVAMFDLDDFKKFNSDYGHLKADEVLKEAADVLKQAAEVLKASVRGSDVIARFGGEEFVAIFPNTTSEAINKTFLDEETGRLRIGMTTLIHGKEVHISFSGGVTQVGANETIKDFKDILTRANQTMLKAKNSGKDQILHFDESEEESVVSSQ